MQTNKSFCAIAMPSPSDTSEGRSSRAADELGMLKVFEKLADDALGAAARPLEAALVICSLYLSLASMSTPSILK